MWYKIKCFFKRYSTVKPRYLDHTYCDSVELMPHLMFELLSRYVEEEADTIEWYGEYLHMIKGENVRDIMQKLYIWWNDIYIKKYDEVADIIYAEMEKHEPSNIFDSENFFNPRWDSKEDKAIYKRLQAAWQKIEVIKEIDLEIKLLQLLKIRRYLWS